MDTIDGLRVFARVMETGSISAAASGLDMSKALASKYLAQLEARLGARLVNRTTRRLSPTEVGRAAYVRCRSILEAVEDMQATVSAEHGEPRGLLRAAAPRAFGEDMLMGAVAGFMARYPDVQVDIALEERLVDIVGEGFDVALRIGALQDSSLIARRITPYPYMICAAPAYLDRAGMPQVPGDLAQHAGIVIGRPDRPVAVRHRWEDRPGADPGPRPRQHRPRRRHPGPCRPGHRPVPLFNRRRRPGRRPPGPAAAALRCLCPAVGLRGVPAGEASAREGAGVCGFPGVVLREIGVRPLAVLSQRLPASVGGPARRRLGGADACPPWREVH